MPMYFPNLDSLKQRAQQRGFRQPNEGESEDQYRAAFADFMITVDRVESAEIRAGKPWDNQSPDELLSNARIDVGPIIQELKENNDAFDAEAYRIAEEAHKGLTDSELKALCRTACADKEWDAMELYRRSRAIYFQEFA